MQSQQGAPVNVSSLQQKIRSTPRKKVSFANVNHDESFNAPKVPVLNPLNSEDIPKAVDTVNKENQLIETTERNIHSSVRATPTQNVSSKSALLKKKSCVKPLNLLQQYASPAAAPVTPSVPRTIISISVKSYACVGKDLFVQTPSPVKDNIVQNTIEADFGKISINEEEKETLESNDISPDTIDHNFENSQTSISFDGSTFSVNTPGRQQPRVPTMPLGPLNFDELSEESIVNEDDVDDSVHSDDESLLKITAAVNKDDKNVRYFLAKPKLIKPESPSTVQPGLRRSQRTRVRKLRSDLGEVPIYNIDENGFRTLVDVTSVEVTDARAKKFLTVDRGEQNKREKELKNQRKMRKEFAKDQLKP